MRCVPITAIAAAAFAASLAASPVAAQDAAGSLSVPSGEPTAAEVPSPPEVPLPPPPQAAGAPSEDGETYFEPDPVLRLDGWLRLGDDRASTARVAVIVLSFVVGAAALSGAVWAYSQDDPDVRGMLGSVFVLDGVFQIGLGLAMLHLTFPQEDRWQRWSRVRARGATLVDVAAFAGELRAEAEAQRFARMVGGATGLAMAAGGAAAIGLAAVTEMSDDARLVSISLGALFLAAGGAVGLVSLLVKSPVERDWERYERGFRPIDPESLALDVAPFLAEDGAGLALVGRL